MAKKVAALPIGDTMMLMPEDASGGLYDPSLLMEDGALGFMEPSQVFDVDDASASSAGMPRHVAYQDSALAASSSRPPCPDLGLPAAVSPPLLSFPPLPAVTPAAGAGDFDEEAAMDKEAAVLLEETMALLGDETAEPAFEEGATVRALPWTNGGGNTGRLFGEGAAVATVVGALSVRPVGRGGGRVSMPCYPISRPEYKGVTYWPADRLIETCASGSDRFAITRTSHRTKEQVHDRKRATDAEAAEERALKGTKKAKKESGQLKKDAKVQKQKTKEAEGRAEEARIREQLANAALVRERRRRESAEKGAKKLKASHEATVCALKEKVAQLQTWRNDANKKKREASRRAERLQKKLDRAISGGGAKTATAKLAPAVRERLDASQAQAIAAEEELERLIDDTEALRGHLKTISDWVAEKKRGGGDISLVPREVVAAVASAAEGAGVGKRKRERGAAAAAKEAAGQKKLWEMLGKKGEAYSQDIIELGLTLMSNQLSAAQAVAVLRAFLRAEYPEKIEGEDYRVPDAGRFREWRRNLEPLCHYISLSVIKVADRLHAAHDATTKNHIHVFQTCFRCEIVGEDGDVTVVDVPLKFEICKSGKAASEAQQVVDAMASDVGGEKVKVPLTKVASCSSDGAARATTSALAAMRLKELEEAQAAVDAHLDKYPEAIAEAAAAYASMNDEQREQAKKMHGLGCAGHALNLVTDNCWKKSEKATISENMALDRAATILQRSFLALSTKTKKCSYTKYCCRCISKRSFSASLFSEASGLDASWREGERGGPAALLPKDKHRDGSSDLPDVSNTINCTSKAFASSGKHWSYYLNEERKLVKYAKGNALPLRRLPSVQGSRQNINVQLATAILANMGTYLAYADAVRVDSEPNKLVETVWNGLRDRYTLAALRARSFIDVTYTAPMIFFTHSSKVTRPMLRTIVDCGEQYIMKLAALQNDSGLPHVSSLALAIVAALHRLAGEEEAAVSKKEVDEVAAAYDSSHDKQKAELAAGYARSIAPETLPLVIRHLAAAAPHMLATHRRDCNLDDDCSKLSELRHAPINTDIVESSFGVFDDALKVKASVKAMIGVAHSRSIKAFTTDAEKNASAMATAKKRARRGTAASSSSSLAAEAATIKKGWDTTSFFSLPREERWRVIKDIQHRYKELCVDDPKARLEEHDSNSLALLEENRAKAVESARNKWLNYKKLESIVPAKSKAELRSLYASFKAPDGSIDDEGRDKAMTDQIRVRIYIHGMKAKELPNMHATPKLGHFKNAERLLGEFESCPVFFSLPAKQPEPAPYPERPAHPAPSAEAEQLQRSHIAKFHSVWKDVLEMTKEGIFSAPKRKSGGGVRKRRTGKRKAPQKKERSPRPGEIELLRAEFVEDGTLWKVLAVDWSDDDHDMVVWYYDVEAATVDEDTMEQMRIDGKAGEVDALEFSSVLEVKKWIAIGEQQ